MSALVVGDTPLAELGSAKANVGTGQPVADASNGSAPSSASGVQSNPARTGRVEAPLHASPAGLAAAPLEPSYTAVVREVYGTATQVERERLRPPQLSRETRLRERIDVLTDRLEAAEAAAERQRVLRERAVRATRVVRASRNLWRQRARDAETMLNKPERRKQAREKAAA